MTAPRARPSSLAPLALVALLGVACSGSDQEVTRIEQVLAQRAESLDLETRRRVARAIHEAHRRFGVDPALLIAVAWHESRFDPLARSRRGALGLMQLLPATAREVAGRAGIAWSGPETLFDPEANITLGAAYLASLRQRFDSWEMALTAYHRGPSRARLRRGRSSVYARRVLESAEAVGERLAGAS